MQKHLLLTNGTTKNCQDKPNNLFILTQNNKIYILAEKKNIYLRFLHDRLRTLNMILFVKKF